MRTQRYLLKVSYDGSRFAGFQRQPQVPTVQGELEQALGELLSAEVTLTCAGRTDKGVNALGQVVRFKLPRGSRGELCLEEVNRRLDRSIRVAALVPAPPGFHPRHSALGRTYGYYLLAEQLPSSKPGPPHPRGRHFLKLQGALDLERMRAAAQVFLGEHDFSTFSYRSGRNGNVRRLHRLSVDHEDGWVCIRMQGNGFLRKMVRLMVTAILECGRGEREVRGLASLLRAREPGLAPHPAPPHALYLESVEYDPDPFETSNEALNSWQKAKALRW